MSNISDKDMKRKGEFSNELGKDLCKAKVSTKDLKEKNQFLEDLNIHLYEVSGNLNSSKKNLDFYVYNIQSKGSKIVNFNKSNYKSLSHPLCKELVETLFAEMEPWVKWFAYKFEFMVGTVLDFDDIKAIIRVSIMNSIFDFDFRKNVKFKTFVQRVAYNAVFNESRKQKKHKQQSFIYTDSYEEDEVLGFKERLDFEMSTGKGIEQLLLEREASIFLKLSCEKLNLDEKTFLSLKINKNVRIDDYCKSVGISRSKYQRELKKVLNKLKYEIESYNQ